MLQLTAEQIAALHAAIAEKAEAEAANFDRELSVVVAKLAAEGWTLPGELGIYAAKKLANTNELDDVNSFLQWYFSLENYSHTKKMVENIMTSTIKENLKKLFDECWQSFQANLYAVCATSLISVIEGILSEFSDDKQDTRMMKVCQKKVDAFPAGGCIIEKHTWISYNSFVRNLYQKSNFNADEPISINRHWLLHGRSAYQIDELDCIRLMNAVHSLCMIIDKE